MNRSPFDHAGAAAPVSRRQVLKEAGVGFGYLALAGLLGPAATKAAAPSAPGAGPGPLAPKAPHLPAKAKRVIFLFMQGAASQMDTWEYKPRLQKDHGKVGPGGGT